MELEKHPVGENASGAEASSVHGTARHFLDAWLNPSTCEQRRADLSLGSSPRTGRWAEDPAGQGGQDALLILTSWDKDFILH